MSTLHDLLSDLADDAPAGRPDPGLWERGVRRRRRRQAARIGAVVAAVAVVAVLAAVVRLQPAAPPPAPVDVPFGQLHLPRAVHAPGPWAPGTDETGAPGPLAVVGLAQRNEATGLRGVRTAPAVFGVSAVDGTALYLDLRGAGSGPFYADALALSPDGTKVGYQRHDARRGEPRVIGFGVYDTVTGRTTLLDDPDNPVIRGGVASELTFSGDSRHLETTYSLTGSEGARQDSLVVWDVATGEPTVAEPAGHYWMPIPGRAPSGVVWSRGGRTFTFDTATGRTTSVRSGFDVGQAVYGPDGRSFAAIDLAGADGTPWRLWAGPRPDALRQLDPGIDVDEILGWRDPRHLVVRQLPDGRAVELDIVTGRATGLGLSLDRDLDSVPRFAADLWANPLVDGVAPDRAGDPRRPWQVGAAGLLVVLLVAGGVLGRRRARR